MDERMGQQNSLKDNAFA